jgi:hypothetical protein
MQYLLFQIFKKRMNKKILLIFGILVSLILGSFLVSAGVCCERIKEEYLDSPLTEFCQIVESEDMCDTGTYEYDGRSYVYRMKTGVEDCERLPECNTGCINTETGQCNDVSVGKCLEDGGNPNPIGKSWEDNPICKKGCCVMEDYADLTTERECQILEKLQNKKSDFDLGTTDRNDCQDNLLSQDLGACVISNAWGERNCAFITESKCTAEGVLDVPGIDSWSQALLETLQTKFHKGYLCTAIINGNPISDCQPSKQTECKDGKVYWKDTCGNFANIYDKNKYENDNYWSEMLDPQESCEASENGDDECGNCDEINTVCKDYIKAGLDKPDNNDGGLVCGSIHCEFTNAAGTTIEYKNGDSWCDGGITGALANSNYEDITGSTSSFKGPLADILNPSNSISNGALSIYVDGSKEIIPEIRYLLENSDSLNNPGSKYFLLTCDKGEIIVEPCLEYRREICVEYFTENEDGKYEKTDNAECIYNNGIPRKIDGKVVGGCTHILNREACESNGRHCKWVPGYRMDRTIVEEKDRRETQGSCVPLIAPGFPFWTGIGAGTCAQGNVTEETLFATFIWRDRDDFDLETWSIGEHGPGGIIDEAERYLGRRCYDKCYAIPFYAKEFDVGMLDAEGNKIYPEDIYDANKNLNWGESNQVFGIGRENIKNPLFDNVLLRNSYDSYKYPILSLFYDRPRFNLPDKIKEYHLSLRQGQYCYQNDEKKNWARGIIDGHRYDCAGIQFDYSRSLRNSREYPIFLTHEEWLNSITERTRAFGDCGYKPAGPTNANDYTDPFSEIIIATFEKINKDGEVKSTMVHEKVIYKGDSEINEKHNLIFISEGESKPLGTIYGEGPCSKYYSDEDGEYVDIDCRAPENCDGEILGNGELGDCYLGEMAGVCCRVDYSIGGEE